MEFKTLFYIIAIIAWLVFKFLEKQKSLLKKIVQTVEPPVGEENTPPIKPVYHKPVKPPIVKKLSKQEIKHKVVLNVEKKQTEILPPIKQNEESPEFLETPSFVDEIRSGNVDWRKAILLSEILRPV